MKLSNCLAVLLAMMLLAATPPARAQESINLRETITVQVAKQTAPAVVYISSSKIVAQRVSPFGNDPMGRFFPNIGRIQMVPVGSLGSGFIVHPDGYIVTNNHVIDGARKISVTLLGGKKYDAQIVSADVTADLAILKIDAPQPLPAIDLGDSSDLMIGEPVIAVGNPLGYSHSVTTGVVSAIHRDLRSDDNQIVLGDLIQTNAAINPGNSGGPLLNAYGQVIGITTVIRGDAQNIGFAIQVNRLRDLIPELMNPGQVTKTKIPLKLKEVRTLAPPSTVNVSLVNAGNDAAIKSIDGQKPKSIIDAYAILLKHTSEPFEVEFDGKPKMKITPEPVPLPDALVKAKSLLGVTVEPVTPMLAERYGLFFEDGMLVTAVERNSVADRAHIQTGDVILQLGQFRVSNLKDLGYLLQQLPDSGQVVVGIARGQTWGFVQLQF